MRNMMSKLLPRLRMLATSFVFKDFDPNELFKTVANTIIGITVVAVFLVGLIKFGQGHAQEDPKKQSDGITAILVAFAIGGLGFTVINLMI